MPQLNAAISNTLACRGLGKNYCLSGLPIAESYRMVLDLGCDRKLLTACQDIQVYFRLQGLCSGSVFDRTYKLIGDKVENNRRYFLGPSGWKIAWMIEEKFWRISNERYKGQILQAQMPK